MEPGSLALLIYSTQVLLIVSAAALAEAICRVSAPTVRQAYWRTVAALCLALPLAGFTTASHSADAVTFDALPVAIATQETVGLIAPSVGPAILWIWACGATVGFVWLLAGAWRVRRLRQQSLPAVLEPYLDELRTAVAPRAECRWSSDLRQPVTIGVRHPVVLLPWRFDDLTPAAKRAVLCHELFHVERRDWVWTVVEAHIRTLLWFHPGVWWLLDRLHLLREQVIDELVVARTSSRRDYMLALMMFADNKPPAVLASAFLRQRHLKSRLRQLLKETHMSFKRLVWTMAALTMVMGVVTGATVRAIPLDLNAIAQNRSGTQLEIRLAEATPAPGLAEAVVSGSGQRVYLHPATLATGADVTSARVIDMGDSRFAVGVTFSGPASARMASGTAAHVGRLLAIVLDGQVVSAPTVRAPVSDSAVISGIFTAASAQELATRLAPVAPTQNGARDGVVLPVPIHQERPQYTPAAMAAQIEGSVLLETLVMADGSVGNVTVVRSLDSDLGLDQQAIDALKLWTWKPGTRNGEPTRVAVQVEMTFMLK